MASQPPRPGNNSPTHFVPPTARELRAQAVQRLQAGLFGLAAIVLVVGLANIINDRARLSDTGAVGQEVAGQDRDRTDPLAEVGVVPAASPDPSPAASAAPKR